MDRRPVGSGLAEDSVAVRLVLDVRERNSAALHGFARRLGLADEAAEDAVQETLLRLFRELRRGSSLDDPKAWAFHTLYRVVMDEHRLHVRIAGLRERLRGRPPEIVSSEPDVVGRISIWATVDRLPPRQRQVLYLRYRADLPYQDIARILGLTAGGARRTAAKGLERLRPLLAAAERDVR